MSSHKRDVSIPKSHCINEISVAVKNGAIHTLATQMTESNREKLTYISELSTEMGRLARQLDEELLAYFFEMAAHEAREAQTRLG